MRRRIPIASLVCALVAGVLRGDASAQTRVDVGLMLGSTRATNAGPVLQFDRGTTYQATVAWWWWRNDAVAVAAEVPFLASPAFTVIPPDATLPLEYASLYLTPGVRVAAFPRAPISIFASVGAGYARYTESKLTGNRSPNPAPRDTNAGALAFGAGVDVRGLKWLGFRAEIRDIYTGSRNFSVANTHPTVHNVVGSGGLVLKF